MARLGASVDKGRQAGRAPSDLAAWVTTYGQGLRRYFARRAPRDDVDDLVQDVFLRLHSAKSTEPIGAAPIGDVEHYLFAVAHNVLISQRRMRSVRRWGLHDTLDDIPEPSCLLSPERILEARQDYAHLLDAVAGLPPRARMAFRLNRFEGLTRAAIAERMGISQESVKELIQRASRSISMTMRSELGAT